MQNTIYIIRSVKILAAQRFKEFFESYGQKLTDQLMNHLVGLDER
jgi:hypothetical protein